ncbi:MAG TPA: VOC family protein [Trebonia sp.]
MGQVSTIGRVLIPVADQDKAIEFYTQMLGFTLTADVPYGNGDRWVEVTRRAAARRSRCARRRATTSRGG